MVTLIFKICNYCRTWVGFKVFMLKITFGKNLKQNPQFKQTKTKQCILQTAHILYLNYENNLLDRVWEYLFAHVDYTSISINSFTFKCLDVFFTSVSFSHLSPAHHQLDLSSRMCQTVHEMNTKDLDWTKKTHLFAVLNYPILAGLPKITWTQ